MLVQANEEGIITEMLENSENVIEIISRRAAVTASSSTSLLKFYE